MPPSPAWVAQVKSLPSGQRGDLGRCGCERLTYAWRDGVREQVRDLTQVEFGLLKQASGSELTV
jgi:hypothetical protein